MARIIGPRSRRPSGHCAICGVWRQSLHRDHILPRWKGGGDEPANIQFICANCHEDKTRGDLKGLPGPNCGRVFSVETRKRMSEAASRSQARAGHTKGHHLSEEHRFKISVANTGRPKIMPPASEQRKQRVSESLRRYWSAKRAS